MSFPTANIEIAQGGTFRQPILIYTQADVADNTETPTLASLVGCHAHMQIRSATGGNVYVDVSDTTGGISIDTVNSIVLINLTSADTFALVNPAARYDIWLEFPDGTTIPLAGGTVTTDLSITSPTELI
jgi:hypothetical protein